MIENVYILLCILLCFFFPFYFVEAPSEVLERLPPHYLEGQGRSYIWQRSQDTKIPLRVRFSGLGIGGPVGWA